MIFLYDKLVFKTDGLGHSFTDTLKKISVIILITIFVGENSNNFRFILQITTKIVNYIILIGMYHLR